MRDLIDNIPSTELKNVSAGIYPSLGWYVASIAQGTDTYPTLQLVYDYKRDTWTVFDYATGLATAPLLYGDFYDTNGNQLLYGAMPDAGASGHLHIWDMVSGADDDGSEIRAWFDTKAFGAGAPGMAKVSSRIALLCQQAAVSMDISVFRNREAAAHNTRTISLDYPEEWKRYSLSSADQASKSLQYRFDYTGTPQLVIAGLLFEMNQLGARMGKVW